MIIITHAANNNKINDDIVLLFSPNFSLLYYKSLSEIDIIMYTDPFGRRYQRHVQLMYIRYNGAVELIVKNSSGELWIFSDKSNI